MYKYLDVMLLDQDPAVILASHLNPNGNKYEISLLKFLEKISICHTSRNRFPIPNIPEIFKIPFNEDELVQQEGIVQQLKDSCIFWTKTIQEALECLPTIESLKDVPHIEYPNAQIGFWRQREKDLNGLIDDFTLPAFERSVQILETAKVDEVILLCEEMKRTRELLKDSEDHVKFLGTIEISLDVIASTLDFEKLIDTIPGVATSLRSIWLLSKCFCTDAKIHGLILMISNLINERVVKSIQLSDFENPSQLKLTVESCVRILEAWKKSFSKVRMDIEESRKEARWEFEINDLFADTDHINSTCKDVIIICHVLVEMKNSFDPEIMKITTRPQYLQTAISKIKAVTEGLYCIKFKPFDKKNSHHWATLIAWFQREVLFLEAESGKIIEETFDYLIQSDRAAKMLRHLKTLALREVIKKKYLKKVNSIILKFNSEISYAENLFSSNYENPPIANNLPPISGSIFWSQSISSSLKSTLVELMELQEVVEFETWPDIKSRLDSFLKKLDFYEIEKYNSWSSKVSNILDKNLSRNLIQPANETSDIGKFSVNFTSDLSDTFAEVINMEKIGFKVPEVAKNMSMQEGRLSEIAGQLQKMLNHYHEVIESVDGADKNLLFENLKETENALHPGLVRLTWNSLGISDYITKSEISICRTESIIRQIQAVRMNIEKKVETIISCKLFEKFITSDKQLCNFEVFYNQIIDFEIKNLKHLVNAYEDICPLLMKIEEILVHSRSKRNSRMAKYYSYWENVIYKALTNMVKINLDDLLKLLSSTTPVFQVEVILDNMNVSISPSEQSILKGIVTIIRCLLDGTKDFVRWCKGSCIPVKEARVQEIIRPVRPSFYEDIVCIPEIISKVELVQNSILGILDQVQTYLATWKKYKNLWKFDKKNTCGKFLERNPSCVDFDEKLLIYSLLERQIKWRERQISFQCMQVSLLPLVETLLSETQQWIKSVGKLLEKTAKEELNNLQGKLDGLKKCLIFPKDGKSLEKVLQAISSIWGMSLQVEITYREIEERYRTLNMYGINVNSNEIRIAQSLPSIWSELFTKSKEMHFRVRPLKEKYTEITKLLIKQFKKEINHLCNQFKVSGPNSVGSNLDEGLLLLKHFNTAFQEACEKGENLNKQEKLYVLPLTNFESLGLLKSEIDTFSEIYEAYQIFRGMETKWKSLSWKKLDLDFAEKDVLSIENTIKELNKKCFEVSTLHEIIKRNEKSKHLFRILRKLKESKLRSRHWLMISTSAEVEIDSENNFKINNLWSIDLIKFENSIDSIIEKANQERKIESDLQGIKEVWEGMKFQVKRQNWYEGGESFYLLDDVSCIIDKLMQHESTLDMMLKSIHCSHFMKEIGFWKGNLNLFGNVVNEWLCVQEIWKKTSKALAVKSFKDLVMKCHSFDEINKRYMRLMAETAKKPTVKDICLGKGFQDIIKQLRCDLEFFQNDLCQALDQKRKQFSKFFFLANDELITVLGGNIREPVVQNLVQSLFQNLNAFVPDDFGMLEVIFTEDFEDLPLCKSINTNNQTIENWLTALHDEMNVCMQLLTKMAVKECILKDENLFIVLKQFPNILTVAVFQMLWTKEMEDILSANIAGTSYPVIDEWKQLYTFSCGLVKKLTSHENLTGPEKKRISLLMTLVLEKRDLIDSFIYSYI